MKNIATAILFAVIAMNTVACGGAGETEADWTGTYAGKDNYNVEFTASEYEWNESDIGDAQISVTESTSGSLLITGIDPNCTLGGNDMGDYIALTAICQHTDNEYGERFTSYYEGEAALSPSGKLNIDLVIEVQYEVQYVYDHGFEWEVDGSGEGIYTFGGRQL